MIMWCVLCYGVCCCRCDVVCGVWRGAWRVCRAYFCVFTLFGIVCGRLYARACVVCGECGECVVRME